MSYGGDSTERAQTANGVPKSFAGLVATIAESLGILNKGSAKAPAAPGANEAAQVQPISSNALNVTRVGGITSLIAGAGGAALLVFNVNKTTDRASIVVAAYASVGVIVAGALFTVAIIIAADIRARTATAVATAPSATPSAAAAPAQPLQHAGVKYVTNGASSLEEAYEYVLVDATAGAINLTLPSATSAAWQQMTIKRVDANAAHDVIIKAQAPDTIDGRAEYALLPQNPVSQIYSNDRVWLTV
jgi:hypothetical protein